MKFFGIICLLSLQVSDGLRVIGSTRAFLNKVTETVNIAAASSHERIAALVVCSVITCSFGLPTPTLAAGNGIASNLFAKAESAIASNLLDYKSLDKEWSTAKKLIADNGNLLSKASSSIGAVNKQMTGYDEIMTNMFTEDVTATSELKSEIDALKISTALKYTAAEASSAVPEKPSITSQLFLVAQNEAMILEQSEISFQRFSDAIGPPGADKDFKKRSDEVLEALTALVGKAADIQAEQASGTSTMSKGLALNTQSCRDSLNACSEGGPAGLSEFKTGVKTVENAQDRYGKLKKEVSAYLKTVQSIESALTKENEGLSSIILDDKLWEEKTGLKLKLGKKTVERVAQKYGNSLKETVKMSQKLLETNNLLTSTEAEKGNKKEVSDELKTVLGLLETANNSGKESEKMLRAAKVQGEKEASKYLKFVKPVVATSTETVSDLSKTVKVAPNNGKSVASK